MFSCFCPGLLVTVTKNTQRNNYRMFARILTLTFADGASDLRVGGAKDLCVGWMPYCLI
jgi:hypothetical protein